MGLAPWIWSPRWMRAVPTRCGWHARHEWQSSGCGQDMGSSAFSLARPWKYTPPAMLQCFHDPTNLQGKFKTCKHRLSMAFSLLIPLNIPFLPTTFVWQLKIITQPTPQPPLKEPPMQMFSVTSLESTCVSRCRSSPSRYRTVKAWTFERSPPSKVG